MTRLSVTLGTQRQPRQASLSIFPEHYVRVFQRPGHFVSGTIDVVLIRPASRYDSWANLDISPGGSVPRKWRSAGSSGPSWRCRMRYRGAGRSPWPMILIIVLIIIVVVAAYWLFFMAPPGINPF
jgi:hypothetical protein